MPGKFLGDRTASYNGFLRFTCVERISPRIVCIHLQRVQLQPTPLPQ